MPPECLAFSRTERFFLSAGERLFFHWMENRYWRCIRRFCRRPNIRTNPEEYAETTDPGELLPQILDPESGVLDRLEELVQAG